MGVMHPVGDQGARVCADTLGKWNWEDVWKYSRWKQSLFT